MSDDEGDAFKFAAPGSFFATRTITAAPHSASLVKPNSVPSIIKQSPLNSLLASLSNSPKPIPLLSTPSKASNKVFTPSTPLPSISIPLSTPSFPSTPTSTIVTPSSVSTTPLPSTPTRARATRHSAKLKASPKVPKNSTTYDEEDEKKRKRDINTLKKPSNDADFEESSPKQPRTKRAKKDSSNDSQRRANENIDTSNSNTAYVAKQPAPLKKQTEASKGWGTGTKGWGGKRNNFVKMNLKGKRGKFGRSTTWRYSRQGRTVGKDEHGVQDYGGRLNNEMLEDIPDVCDEDSIRVNNPNKDNNIDYSTVNLHDLLRESFGTTFTRFNSGQEEAIRSVLAGNDTLAVLPTGGGKSLIYQICALAFGGLTLIVSPLIALIADQMAHLPPSLPAATLSSINNNGPSFTQTLSMIRAGRVRVLFVSPERVMSKTFIELVKSGKFPKIHFACIDEAHCVTEWSHNFRPSFLGVAGVLREVVGVKKILALTATATQATEHAICDTLGITHTVRYGSSVKPSVHLSCSFVSIGHENAKYKELTHLVGQMKGPIVVYCSTQRETDMVANHLEIGGHEAMAYHAGKMASERLRIQDLFTKNKIRILAATVAFGMGVDKPDIRNIIHFTIPRSVEHYVQEVGRAGRDGLEAYAHVFLSDEDATRIHSLAHTDGVDEHQINGILKIIFGEKKPKNHLQKFAVLPKAKTVHDIDVREEVLATILTYLSMPPYSVITLLPDVMSVCALSFYKTDPVEMKAKYPLVKMLMEHVIGSAHRAQGNTNCDIAAVGTRSGIPMKDIVDKLTDLQKSGEIKFVLDNPGWYVEAVKELDSNQIQQLARTIADKMSLLEKERAAKVVQMFNLFKRAAAPVVTHAIPSHPAYASRDSLLHEQVDAYFTKDFTKDSSLFATTSITPSLSRSSSSVSSTTITPLPSQDRSPYISPECSDEEEEDVDSDCDIIFNRPSSQDRAPYISPECSDEEEEDVDSDCDTTFNTRTNMETDSGNKLENESENEKEKVPTPAAASDGMHIDESLCGKWIFVRGDIYVFLKRVGGVTGANSRNWSGRNIARIFHGLSSTLFPYEEWHRDPAWGRHKTYPFNKLMQLADETIEKFKTLPGITVLQRDEDD